MLWKKKLLNTFSSKRFNSTFFIDVCALINRHLLSFKQKDNLIDISNIFMKFLNIKILNKIITTFFKSDLSERLLQRFNVLLGYVNEMLALGIFILTFSVLLKSNHV